MVYLSCDLLLSPRPRSLAAAATAACLLVCIITTNACRAPPGVRCWLDWERQTKILRLFCFSLARIGNAAATRPAAAHNVIIISDPQIITVSPKRSNSLMKHEEEDRPRYYYCRFLSSPLRVCGLVLQPTIRSFIATRRVD